MKLRNQNGAALVVVLLMISVFFVLGLSLLSSSLSNTKQVNKTEKEMQALDLAEMGVLHYRNHFKENAYQYLKAPIETAMNNSQNNTLNKKIDAIYGLLDQENLKYKLLNFPQRTINELGHYTITIKNPNSIFSAGHDKISVNISSLGKINSGTEKSIDATIELSIQQLIEDMAKDNTSLGNTEEALPIPAGLTSCPHTNNLNLTNGCFYDKIPGTAVFAAADGIDKDTSVYINGNAIIGAISGGINKDTRIDINGDATFGAISGGINKDTIININGNGVFGAISGGINKTSTIFVKKDATFAVLSGGVKDEAKICVGGKIIGLELLKVLGKYPSGIYSYSEDPNSYNEAGCPPIHTIQNDPLSFNSQSLAKNTAIISVKYH